MRLSRFHLQTVRETPADAEIVSHQLMLRAGLIRKLTGGIYTWTPLGLRVLRKVERIVREEMDRAGALEVQMPAVQPKELWIETGRWEKFGPQLLKMKDRAEREYCFGPTHEEVITDFARAELKSYKQLPINFYQIQTKFRDEIRPRFGVMRAREFLMKDAYSFHLTQECLAREYQNMYDTYARIFTRLGLKFRAVAADTGAIGGSASHEFHVLADSGEDAIAFCDASDYAANVELAEAVSPGPRPDATEAMQRVPTPTQRTCEDVAALLGLPLTRTVKSIALTTEAGFVLVLVRGDHQLNEIKLAKLAGLAEQRLATEAEIRAHLGASPGFLGPVAPLKPVRVIADRSVAAMADFVCGANADGFHLTGVNFGRDLPEPEVADVRNVVDGDASPDGAGTIRIARGIEVGHVFQLGTKYAAAMDARVLDPDGKAQTMTMGCYGIGVSRIVGAAIEQNHDAQGIAWPTAIAPFEVSLLALAGKGGDQVRATCDALYAELTAAGIEVLYDDRGLRPGVMFADHELIGIPHRLVVSDRGITAGSYEYRGRRDAENSAVPAGEALAFLLAKLGRG